MYYEGMTENMIVELSKAIQTMYAIVCSLKRDEILRGKWGGDKVGENTWDKI